jgi:hypothetical protein
MVKLSKIQKYFQMKDYHIFFLMLKQPELMSNYRDK